MKILFISASYLPTTNGVITHMVSTAKMLRNKGHDVYILAPNFPGYKDYQKNVIRYPSLPNPFVKNVPIGIPIVTFNKVKRLKIDIIHTHHPFLAGQLAAQLAEKLKVPLFFTAHTEYEQYLNYYFPFGYDITSKILIRDIKNLAFRCASVICPTKHVQLKLAKMGVSNTVVISNGVDKEFIIKPQKEKNAIPTLVFTGRIEKEKNLFLLLKIAAELRKRMPDFQLLIIGNGTQFTKISENIVKLGLQSNIILTGEINRSLLPAIYSSAHIFITPSTSEVMPISILEAMGCGLPIIGLLNSNLDNLIAKNKNGYLLAARPKSIALKIEQLIKNKKTLEAFSKNSTQIAQKFTSEKTAGLLEKLYRKAIS